MTKKTHLFMGAAITLVFTHNPFSFIGLIGSLAPDWDYKVGIKHRTITHSILAVLVTTALIYVFNKQIALVWCLNYSLHLLADSLTVTGIPFLFPFNKHCYGLKIMKTGDPIDLLIMLIAIYATFTLAI